MRAATTSWAAAVRPRRWSRPAPSARTSRVRSGSSALQPRRPATRRSTSSRRASSTMSMWHSRFIPNSVSSTEIVLLAIADREVRFHGQAAHPVGAPWLGRSALDAVIAAVPVHQPVAALRQARRLHPWRRSRRGRRLPTSCRRRPPPGSSSEALATRTSTSCWRASSGWHRPPRWRPSARSRYSRARPIVVERCGTTRSSPSSGGDISRTEAVPTGPQPPALGSSDMGNVSQVVPTIHPYLAVATPGTAPPHRRVRQSVRRSCGR